MSKFGKKMLTVIVLMLLGVLLGMQLAGSNFQVGNIPEVPAVVKTEPEPAVESEPAVPVQQEEKRRRLFLYKRRVKCLGRNRTKHPWMCLRTKRRDCFRICLIMELSG